MQGVLAVLEEEAEAAEAVECMEVLEQEIVVVMAVREATAEEGEKEDLVMEAEVMVAAALVVLD